MNITRTIFLLLLLPGFAPEISGQQTSYTNDPIINDDGKNGYSRWEGVFLHTDRNEYVAGEYIWYAAYLINPGIESTKGKRNTAYVELLNFDNQPVVQKTIGIADGSGHGCFIIPDTLSSGSYILRSYTNYMKNFSPEQCFMKVINIYNTFSNRKFTSVSLNGERPGPGLILSPVVFKQPGVFNQNKGTEIAGYKENSLAEADRTGSLIRVQTKESFKRREKITVELYADSGLVTSGNYARMSISVSAPERQESSGDITGYASILRSILPEIKAEKNGSRELKLGSEENGRLLYGRVVSRNLHVSVPDNIVILSVPGKEARFQYAVTDSNGNFSFQIDIDSLERDVVLQVVENPGNALIMISSPFWESYPGFGRNPDTFISGVPPYIEDWSINYQVARVYGTRPSIDSPVPGKSALLPYRFYGIPDFELIMDDYILLPVMQEVFFELVPGVTMRSNRNGYKITVINPRDNRPYDTDATLMVDGVIVTDPLVIAGLNTEDVERIDVVRDEYFVGGYHFFGILNVVTRKGDSGSISLPADAVKLQYRETAPEPEFFSPGYTSTGEGSPRIPDYRNTLYWNPDIKISRDGKATVEFHASDYVSGYVIKIQGITSDGKPFSAEKRIRVEDK